MHVVITGANRGIGKTLHDRYSKAGHTVTGTARSGAPYFPLDVTKADQQAALAEALDGRPVDLLICNAGIYADKGQNLADEFAASLWAQTFATNVTGAFLTIQALLSSLQASSTAKVALISSRLGSQELAEGGNYIYRSSKAALLNLGRNLAVDIKPLGISVGIYHPGWVRTDMGGPAGEISVDEAVDGLVAQFEALGLDSTGSFKTWDGRELPF